MYANHCKCTLKGTAAYIMNYIELILVQIQSPVSKETPRTY